MIKKMLEYIIFYKYFYHHFIQYLQLTVQQMSESWEDILMEMDSKLLKFAQEKKVNLG